MKTNPKKVNYDQLAATYNRRFAEDKRSGIARALKALSAELHARYVLEIGCGTGRWLKEFTTSAEDDHQVYGMDLSLEMLLQAQQRGQPYHLSQGEAGLPPFPTGRFDLVYCVNAIHHFPDKPRFIQEAFRLLRPGGALAVVGFQPQHHKDRWFVYDYFPGTYETDLARFPTWGKVLDWMTEAGFRQVKIQPVETIQAGKNGRDILASEFLEKHGCSQLALLDEEAYRSGRSKIEHDIEQAEANGTTIFFPSAIQMDMLCAIR